MSESKNVKIGGFGFYFDIKTRKLRSWYIKEGVKRWADDDSPVEEKKR